MEFFFIAVIENSVSEEEVFLPEDSISLGENGELLVALIVGLRDDMSALARALKTIQVTNIINYGD